MRPFAFRSLAAAAAVACLAGPAWSLDLAEAYKLALERDATVRASRAAADAGRERLPQARSQLLPSVSLSSSRFRNELNTTSPGFLGGVTKSHEFYDSINDGLVVRQPIYRKALSAQVRAAEANVAEANATLERDEQTLVMRVTQAYFEALLAEEQLILIGVQKGAYAAQVDAARKSFNAGAGTRTDIDEAQSRLDMSLAQELEAKQAVDVTRRQLQVLINQPVTQLAKVDVAKLKLGDPVPDTVEQWTMLAEDASPEVAAVRAQVDSARADVERARAGHYPTLDAIAQLSRSESDTPQRVGSRFLQKQIGVQLNVPIFQGGYVNSQVREALALLDRAENHLEEVRRDLGVRVHREFKGVSEGVLKVRALEQAVRSSEQLVTSSRRSFEAGSRTRIDILNAEQQASTARRDLAQARLAYLLSRVRLKALTGGFKAENIDEVNGWLQH
jgi:outer membrane protein/protease secretion system outer membrane protein